MGHVYIYDDDCYLKVDCNRLLLTNKTKKKSIPLESVSSVVMFGKSQVSTSCIYEFAKMQIPIMWISKKGKFISKIQSSYKTSIKKQRMQFDLSHDGSFRLELSKKWIFAKVRNQKIILKRLAKSFTNNHNISNDDIKRFNQFEEKITRANRIQSLLGYEGIAAKYYFENLGKTLNKEFKFEKRSRRPPKDEVNSVLSFGYTLLLYEFYSALELKGLNPYAGYMHEDSENHPTLASDLMEEWRPIIIDSIVVRMFNHNKFEQKHFDYSNYNNGVYLNKLGSALFLQEYEKKLNEPNNYLDWIQKPLTFREAIYHQVDTLCNAILKEDANIYKSVIIR